MAHGCELETSVLLYLRGDLVQMEKAERDINFQTTEFFYWDLEAPSPVFFQEWFSRYSQDRHRGRSDQGHAEKGENDLWQRWWSGWWICCGSSARARSRRGWTITDDRMPEPDPRLR